MTPDTGSTPAICRDDSATRSAAPSQSSTPSQCNAPLSRISTLGKSPEFFALVQRLNAGASGATENNTTTHTE